MLCLQHARADPTTCLALLSQLGSVIGGSINLALNADTNRTGGISVNTYSVFIAIQVRPARRTLPRASRS